MSFFFIILASGQVRSSQPSCGKSNTGRTEPGRFQIRSGQVRSVQVISTSPTTSHYHYYNEYTRYVHTLTSWQRATSPQRVTMPTPSPSPHSAPPPTPPPPDDSEAEAVGNIARIRDQHTHCYVRSPSPSPHRDVGRTASSDTHINAVYAVTHSPGELATGGGKARRGMRGKEGAGGRTGRWDTMPAPAGTDRPAEVGLRSHMQIESNQSECFEQSQRRLIEFGARPTGKRVSSKSRWMVLQLNKETFGNNRPRSKYARSKKHINRHPHDNDLRHIHTYIIL